MRHASPADGEPVRVAVVSCVHRWNDTRIFLRQSVALAAQGYDVLLVGIGEQPVPAVCSGVRVHALPRRRRLLRWITWCSILRLLFAQGPAIVHAHDPELFPVVLPFRLLGRRVVCDVHEDLGQQVLHKEWIPHALRRPLSRALAAAQRWLPRAADAVILAEDSYVRNFPCAPNVTVVRNFPVLPARAKRIYRSEVLRLVYVGDIRIVRGVSECIELTHRLVHQGIPAELHLVGSFADAQEEAQMQALVHRLGLDRRVQFLGRRPPEEIPFLVQECDVGLALLHPIGNYRESYPSKMFEYMAAGLPVVASHFPLWERVLVDHDCGRVVDPLDVDAAAQAVAAYWRRPEVRERHGSNGRAAAAERYNWNRELPSLLAVYASLVPAVAATQARP
jgi:glycosyltransferase involved in cell wall biosynthesis